MLDALLELHVFVQKQSIANENLAGDSHKRCTGTWKRKDRSGLRIMNWSNCSKGECRKIGGLSDLQ